MKAENVRRLANAAGVSIGQMDAIITLLSDFPSNGKPQDREATTDAHLLGLISHHEVHKSCPSCGQSLMDYSYFKLSAAGRLFMALLAQREEKL